ncbi:MAG: LLM class F420-dependent oxidoreductase [Actinomycetota bacterium]|nr:LLM class F420-dependent oxidoreductase [Actinomycetota bacterium]
MTPPLLPGPVGIWTVALDALPTGQAQEQVAELDELGYDALWYGEAYGREAFTAAALYLQASRRMVVAPGIASIYARDAMATNGAARGLSAAYPDRFLLGLGVSHAPLVERMRGHSYGKPVTAMREYLDAMDRAPYLVAGPPDTPPRVLAALGPRMLELSRDRAQGAHPYLVTPEHTAQARAVLGEGPVLAVEQSVALTTDRETFLQRAHWHLEIYSGLPNYRNSWFRLGFDESDAVRGGSERLKDALVVGGDEQAVVRRVREHLDAGASHVCLQLLGNSVGDVPAEDWRRLAPALADLRS